MYKAASWQQRNLGPLSVGGSFLTSALRNRIDCGKVPATNISSHPIEQMKITNRRKHCFLIGITAGQSKAKDCVEVSWFVQLQLAASIVLASLVGPHQRRSELYTEGPNRLI